MFLPKKTKRKFSLLKMFGSNHQMDFRHRNALNFLNITQFLGALNDNIYKFLTVFLLIDIKGAADSSVVLFWVGIIYVLPFLLFSSSAGILADRFSKQKIIVAMKIFEVFIMFGAVLAFYYQSPIGSYIMLFLLSAQSAIFGPPKYSIIPELVKPQRISKANGLITSSTYLAIILGSFLASFVTKITDRNFTMTAIFCFFIAIVGFFTSLIIPKTIPQRQKQKITPFFIKEIYQTLKYCTSLRYFLIAMFASFFFLFIGAYIQLNIVPFGMQSLGLSEVDGGFLFLAAAIGIALGAIVAGRTKKKTGNLGLSVLAMLIVAISFLIVPIVSFSLTFTVIMLIVLGFGGGLYIVPIDSFIQSQSPIEKRGKIIAASNFLSFCGVMFAPIALYIFSGMLYLSAALGFFLMSLIALSVFIFMARKLSGIFLNYASRKLLYPFYSVDLQPSDIDIRAINAFLMPATSWVYPSLLLGIRTRYHLFVAKKQRSPFDFLLTLFKNVHFIYYGKAPFFVYESFSRTLKLTASSEIIPCLVVFGFTNSQMNHLKEELGSKVTTINAEEDYYKLSGPSKLWKRAHITFHIGEDHISYRQKKKRRLLSIFSK